MYVHSRNYSPHVPTQIYVVLQLENVTGSLSITTHDHDSVIYALIQIKYSMYVATYILHYVLTQIRMVLQLNT